MPPSREAFACAWAEVLRVDVSDGEKVWDTLVYEEGRYSPAIADWWAGWVQRQRKRHKRIA
jgi:hypothetical protein